MINYFFYNPDIFEVDLPEKCGVININAMVNSVVGVEVQFCIQSMLFLVHGLGFFRPSVRREYCSRGSRPLSHFVQLASFMSMHVGGRHGTMLLENGGCGNMPHFVLFITLRKCDFTLLRGAMRRRRWEKRALAFLMSENALLGRIIGERGLAEMILRDV
jgi:hypothetical protein